jgi:Zn-dependent protease
LLETLQDPRFYIELVLALPLLLLAVSTHEAAHALVAHWRGDDTARSRGRISLLPWRHVDPLGSLVLPALLLLMGLPALATAKPTPVDPEKLKNPRLDFSLVALAGPASNFLLALALAGGAWLLLAVLRLPIPELSLVLANGIRLSLLLAFFNLMPLPTLDGLKVLYAFLPESWCWRLNRLEPFGIFFVYLALVLGLFTAVMAPAWRATEFWMFRLARLTP